MNNNVERIRNKSVTNLKKLKVMINTDKNHKHTYDAQGRMTCCTQEEKIYTQAGAKELVKEKHQHNHSDDDGHDHSHSESSPMRMFLPCIISLILMLVAITFDNWLPQQWFTGWVRIIWYVVAYAPVGFPVLKDALKSIRKGEIFSEFFLMGIATIGA